MSNLNVDRVINSSLDHLVLKFRYHKHKIHLQIPNSSCMQSEPISDLSDISQVFRVDDIFTRKDAISGLKISSWEGLGKLANTLLDSSIFGI